MRPPGLLHLPAQLSVRVVARPHVEVHLAALDERHEVGDGLALEGAHELSVR